MTWPACSITLHTGSARTDHFHLLNGAVPRLLEQAVAVARLAAEVVAGLEIHAERWARAAREGFTAAADVADALAVEAGLDYRTAHHWSDGPCASWWRRASRPTALTPERLAAAAEAAGGGPVAISEAALADALDPAACVLARRQLGSAAPGEVAAMIAECRERTAEARAWSAAARDRALQARGDLIATARRLAGR